MIQNAVFREEKSSMEYLKIEQIAKKWDISVRRVQLLCADGKIEGAVRFGRAWMIPKNAKKPVDGRTRAGRSLVNENMPLPRKYKSLTKFIM